MHPLLALYRHALRVANFPLAAALTPALRADPHLSARADRELRSAPRAPARWSAAAERAVDAVVLRLRRDG